MRAARQGRGGLIAMAATLAALVSAVGAGSAHAAFADGVLDTYLLSRADGATGEPGDDASQNAATSENGRYTAFFSDADNLGFGALPTQVFLRDAVANTTILVSRTDGPAGDPASESAQTNDTAISPDGRYVAFTTQANNLAGEETAVVQVYLRDTVAGTTTLISRTPGGTPGDDSSSNPSVSDDGRYVAFDSLADNLSGEDTGGVYDVFLRDTVANTTMLISRAAGAGGTAGDDDSLLPRISADGHRVAFYSDANSLSTVDDNSVNNVFVRDTVANTTTLASRADGAAGAAGNGNSVGLSLSDDGTKVAIQSGASNLGDDADTKYDVFVRDTVANTTVLASRAGGASGDPGDDESINPSISGDGTRVAFESVADNLSGVDTASVYDIFVRDLQANTTSLASRALGAAGDVADDHSARPSISGDGNRVAFDSMADNLDSATTAFNDIFLREISDPRPPCHGLPATIVGTRLSETIVGTAGADVIVALGGDDEVDGGGGADRICGGSGDDRLLGQNGSDRVFGEDGADRILGGNGNDSLLGQNGPDRIFGGAQADRIYGGAQADRIFGGAQADRILGQNGPDRLFGQNGPDRIFGGAQADRIFGGAQADRIFGGAQADRILGQNGPDRLFGQNGPDRLFGGRHRDRIFGGRHNDLLVGGPAFDLLRGGPGRNRVRQ